MKTKLLGIVLLLTPFWGFSQIENQHKKFVLNEFKISELNNYVRQALEANKSKATNTNIPFYIPKEPYFNFSLKTEKGDFDFTLREDYQISLENEDIEHPYFTGKIQGNEESFVQMVLVEDYFSMTIMEVEKEASSNHQKNGHDHPKINSYEISNVRIMGDKQLKELNVTDKKTGSDYFIIYSNDDLKEVEEEEGPEDKFCELSEDNADDVFSDDDFVTDNTKSNNKVKTAYMGSRTIWVEVHPWNDYQNVHRSASSGAAHMVNRYSKLFVLYSRFSHVAGYDLCKKVYTFHSSELRVVVDYKHGSNSVLHNWSYTGDASYFSHYIKNQVGRARSSDNQHKVIMGVTHDAYVDSNGNRAIRGQASLSGYFQGSWSRCGYTNTIDYHIVNHELYHFFGARHRDADGWTCGSWDHFLDYGHSYAGHIHGTVMSYIDDYCANMSIITFGVVKNHLRSEFSEHPIFCAPDDPELNYVFGWDSYSFECQISGTTINKGDEGFDGRSHPAKHFTYSFAVYGNTTVEITVDNANYDTYLYLLDENYNLVKKDDDGYPVSYPLESYESFWSHMTVTLQQGKKYYAVVSGYESDEGDYRLTIKTEGLKSVNDNSLSQDEIPVETSKERMIRSYSSQEFIQQMSTPLSSYEEYAIEKLASIKNPENYVGTDYGFSNKNYLLPVTADPDINFLTTFPNPVEHELEINISESIPPNACVNIVNALGQTIWSSTYEEIQKQFKLNVSDWHSGVYILELRNNTGKLIESQKITKK